jgi:hypothetical protein
MKLTFWTNSGMILGFLLGADYSVIDVDYRFVAIVMVFSGTIGLLVGIALEKFATNQRLH